MSTTAITETSTSGTWGSINEPNEEHLTVAERIEGALEFEAPPDRNISPDNTLVGGIQVGTVTGIWIEEREHEGRFYEVLVMSLSTGDDTHTLEQIWNPESEYRKRQLVSLLQTCGVGSENAEEIIGNTVYLATGKPRFTRPSYTSSDISIFRSQQYWYAGTAQITGISLMLLSILVMVIASSGLAFSVLGLGALISFYPFVVSHKYAAYF